MNKELKELIKSDIYRHYGCSKKPFLWKRHNPSLNYQIVLRKAHYFNCVKQSIIKGKYYRYALNKISRKMQMQIPYTAEIGKGLIIIHFGRLILSPETKIGSNCNLFTGVTIGSTTRGEKKGVPIIGDRVWIGPNAVIVGKVKIGNNVLIAANSYVNFDVPDNSIVIGNPGKIKSSTNATESYICQTWENDN